jgi:hypothetical protein
MCTYLGLILLPFCRQHETDEASASASVELVVGYWEVRVLLQLRKQITRCIRNLPCGENGIAEHRQKLSVPIGVLAVGEMGTAGKEAE